MISKFDPKKYLVPGDAIYIVVIVLGLFFLVFLNDLPVRLIGACIALLSGVVLVMNLSSRLKETVEMRRPAPSQSVELSVKVKKDSSGTRYVFDDFESSFGGDDVPTRSADESDPPDVKRLRFDDTEASNELPVVTRRVSAYSREAPAATAPVREEQLPTDFSDEISGMRIKSRRAVTADVPSPDVESLTGKVALQEAGGEPETAPVRPAVSDPEPAPPTRVPEPDVSVVADTDDRTREQAIDDQPVIPTRDANATGVTESQTQKRELDPVPHEIPLYADVAPASLPRQSEQYSGTYADHRPSPEFRDSQASEPQSDSSTKSAAQDMQQGAKQRQLLLALANLIDDVEHPGDEEPRKEFDYLLSRVLMVIRSMMNARTAAFFWVNLEQEELVLETRITDVPDVFRQQRKYALGMDIVSQIARSGRPEILTEIKPSAQSDLIPYYSEPAGTTSFVGVPVFLNHTVIGVLCADSTQDDAYDEITIGSLGHFTKLISGLTQSYTGKYDLLQSSRTLEALAHFRSFVNTPGATMQQIAAALVESSSTIVESQTIGVVLFDRDLQSWTIHNILSQHPETELLSGQRISTENSLVFRTIHLGVTNCISPIQQGVCRYHPREAELDRGFFIAVPLKSTTNCYGALFAEGHASQLTHRDIAILETIGEQTGIILEQIHMQKVLKKQALLDEGTGLLNSAAYISRLEEEIVRARDNKEPLVAVLISIDRYNAIEHQLAHADKEEIFVHVLSLVRKHVRSYDVLGRVDDNIIALVMSGSKDTESQIWAERLRKEIAISVKEINKKRYTVTVSIGLAKAVNDDDAESLLTNAGRAMEIASAKTNNVVVFS